MDDTYGDLLRMLENPMEPISDIPTDTLPISIAQLCYYSYDEPISNIARDVSDPGKTYPPIPNPKWSWEVTWGPALDEEQGNLAYVAALLYKEEGQPTVIAAVAVIIRGTIHSGIEATLQDLWQDMDVLGQGNLPWLLDQPDVYVANGSLDGLASIQSLKDVNGRGLLDYLQSLPAVRGDYPAIVVAGHSLGGCIATVIAPWLMSALPAERTKILLPMTFAAPTAGNQQFVQYFNSVCGKYFGYANTLDCIPLAWSNLSGMEGIYDPTDPPPGETTYPTPLAIDVWIDATNAELELAGSSYAQIPLKFGRALEGSLITLSDPIYGLEFLQELLAQHAIANYLKLMNVIGPYAFDETAPRMQRLDPRQSLA